ncbi:hypothetical protein [Bowmanella dokdonensis]|uniref:Uncharacterized protein n=1 Tax=Bowmanella dokdonensis TaxID=751969 RepID=A0A939DMC2_9ALTE|nr:hypothetical protein [Bowmanella dokdonensis]MBN7825409.1 hypothetical protein [Bowmanella dokdonensis]
MLTIANLVRVCRISRVRLLYDEIEDLLQPSLLEHQVERSGGCQVRTT